MYSSEGSWTHHCKVVLKTLEDCFSAHKLKFLHGLIPLKLHSRQSTWIATFPQSTFAYSRYKWSGLLNDVNVYSETEGERGPLLKEQAWNLFCLCGVCSRTGVPIIHKQKLTAHCSGLRMCVQNTFFQSGTPLSAYLLPYLMGQNEPRLPPLLLHTVSDHDGKV